MEKTLIARAAIAVLVCLMVSCASKKTMVQSTETLPTTEAESVSPAVRKLTFVQKVYDNQVYAKNIVGDMSFQLKMGSKDITVPGTLRMRKDEVIRIQLYIPFLGTEIGRLEFTPDYVLVVDRMHKEYIKADYTQIDFLRDQGVSFYSLQALFWNQLLLPGVGKVGESDLKKFDVDFQTTTNNYPVSFQNGAMTYQWQADKTTGRIMQAIVDYQSSSHGTSTLTMDYGNFQSVGVKSFPARIGMRFSTRPTGKQREMELNMDLDKVTTDAKWDAQTQVSSKYKQVNPQDVLGKLLNM